MQKIHVTKKILSVLLAVVLLCAVLPARVTGEEPALFRVALLYSDTTNAEGGSVKVALKLTSQDENDDSYNAYHFVLRYDSERLGYGGIATAGEAMPEIVEDSNGTLTIAGYGEQRIGQSFVVTFNVRAVGDAQVTLTEAYMDRGVNALRDARAADITTSTVTIHAGGCAVELPDVEGISGASFVLKGQDYTFSAPAGMDYGFTAEMDGQAVAVEDNGDGTYTVSAVTGNLVIYASEPVSRTYTVELTGSGQDDVVQWSSKATFGNDYIFSVNRANNYDYAVSVTVGGRLVNPIANGSTYTIPGGEITGDVVITVIKAAQSGTTQVVFVGSGAADVMDGKGSYQAKNDKEFQFFIDPTDDCTYTISAQRSGRTVTFEAMERENWYRIPASEMTGGIITVTVTKTQQPRISVTASTFVKRDGDEVVLLKAVPGTALPAGKGLYYGSQPMFWSQEYGAYVWLAATADSLPNTVSAARKQITVGTGSSTSLRYSGDVNGSGTVDINDAQYIYELYHANLYADTAGAGNVLQLLTCDMNRDGQIAVDDARVVAYKLISR